MRAHVMDGILIVNTIEVASLDFIPNLIDASIGGGIGDTIVDGVLIPKPISPAVSQPNTEDFLAMQSRRADSLAEKGDQVGALLLRRKYEI